MGRSAVAVKRSLPRSWNIQSAAVSAMKRPKKKASSCASVASGRGVTCRTARKMSTPCTALKPLPSTSTQSTARIICFDVRSVAARRYMMPR